MSLQDRKEPHFGSAASNNLPKQPININLSTKKAPDFTFTPVNVPTNNAVRSVFEPQANAVTETAQNAINQASQTAETASQHAVNQAEAVISSASSHVNAGLEALESATETATTTVENATAAPLQIDLNAFVDTSAVPPPAETPVENSAPSFLEQLKASAETASQPQAQTVETDNAQAEPAPQPEPVSAPENAAINSMFNTPITPPEAPDLTVPAKGLNYKRVGAVAISAALLIGGIIWLKPSADSNFAGQEELTLQTNGAQSNEIPAEFRPLDEKEAQRLAAEANARAQAEAKSAESAPPAAETTTTDSKTAETESASNSESTTASTASTNATPRDSSATVESNANTNTESANRLVTNENSARPASQETQLQVVRSAKASAETPRNTAKTSVKEAEKTAEKTATHAKNSVKAATEAPAEELHLARVVPRNERQAESDTKKADEKRDSESKASGKTSFVMAKGQSLMQAFRDHSLSIADVNAMTKAEGGDILNRLRAGDRISVKLDSQGRVLEMRLPNGNTFVRQANGSYRLVK